MVEQWKDIVGHEGRYEVSNLGRIRSFRGNILKPIDNGKGYLYVYLKYGGEKKSYIHRLVAEAFVHNEAPEINKVVNHLDFNPKNNCADNLEWTTPNGNMFYSIRAGRYARTEKWLRNLRETNEKTGKSVIGTNIKTGEKIHFICLNDSLKSGFQPSCISNCCKGKRKTHKGYYWNYVT